jgi:hypothetical protein
VKSITVNCAAIPTAKPVPRRGRTRVRFEDERPRGPETCRSHGRHFGLFALGKQSCPLCILPEVRSGEAQFADLDAAHDALALLLARLGSMPWQVQRPSAFDVLSADDAEWSMTYRDEGQEPTVWVSGSPERPYDEGETQKPYYDLLAADAKRRRTETVERVVVLMGDDGHLPWAPRLLTVEEVAEALRVDPSTVRRQAGQSLPAPIRVGSRMLFRADAVLAMLGGPSPEAPAVRTAKLPSPAR